VVWLFGRLHVRRQRAIIAYYAKSVFTRESASVILCLFHIILLRPFGLSSVFGETESNDMTQVVSNVIVKNFESIRPRKLLVASVLLAVQPITSASKRPQPRKTDILKVFQEGDEAPIIARLSLPRTHFSEILGLSYSKKKQGNSDVRFRSWWHQWGFIVRDQKSSPQIEVTWGCRPNDEQHKWIGAEDFVWAPKVLIQDSAQARFSAVSKAMWTQKGFTYNWLYLSLAFWWKQRKGNWDGRKHGHSEENKESSKFRLIGSLNI